MQVNEEMYKKWCIVCRLTKDAQVLKVALKAANQIPGPHTTAALGGTRRGGNPDRRSIHKTSLQRE